MTLQAIATRDAMAKCLYGALFDWIVLQVNHALISKRDYQEHKVRQSLFGGLQYSILKMTFGHLRPRVSGHELLAYMHCTLIFEPGLTLFHLNIFCKIEN